MRTTCGGSAPTRVNCSATGSTPAGCIPCHSTEISNERIRFVEHDARRFPCRVALGTRPGGRSRLLRTLVVRQRLRGLAARRDRGRRELLAVGRRTPPPHADRAQLRRGRAPPCALERVAAPVVAHRALPQQLGTRVGPDAERAARQRTAVCVPRRPAALSPSPFAL